MGFLEGFERPDEVGGGDGGNDQTTKNESQPSAMGGANPTEVIASKMMNPEDNQLSMRERREKKVAEARVRYLERRRLAQ